MIEATAALATADLLATAIFAVTGALVASRKQLDILGFVWLAAATGIGGGTVRDLLLGVPVFWIINPVYLSICVGVAIVMHFAATLVASRQTWILRADAFGMAFAAVVGTAKALELGASALVAVVMGLSSATAGGIIRDTLGQEPNIILRSEIYMTATVLGAVAVVAGHWLGQPMVLSMATGFVLAVVLRLAAIQFDLKLPVYKPRQGRPWDGQS